MGGIATRERNQVWALSDTLVPTTFLKPPSIREAFRFAHSEETGCFATAIDRSFRRGSDEYKR